MIDRSEMENFTKSSFDLPKSLLGILSIIYHLYSYRLVDFVDIFLILAGYL